jgi:hypothetical protein
VTIYPSEDDVSNSASTPIATADPNRSGNITTSFVAPDTLGDLDLFACQECPSTDEFPSATATLTLQPVSVSPTLSPLLVRVPNVVGDTLTQAERVLTRHGLEPAIRWIGSGQERGSVVAESPAPGTRVRPGTTVTVTAKRTRVIVIAPAGRSWARPAASGGVLILVVLAGALLWWRPHRQRLWVRRHIGTEPRAGPPAEVAVHHLAHPAERSVRFELHRDRGSQTLEEVGP